MRQWSADDDAGAICRHLSMVNGFKIGFMFVIVVVKIIIIPH